MLPENYGSRMKVMGYTSLAIAVLGLSIILLRPELIVEPLVLGAFMTVVGVVSLTIALMELRKIDEGEIRWDEREERIETKAGDVAFRVTFVVEGVLLAVFGFTGIEVGVYPVAGLLMAITGLTYVTFRRWYESKM